MTEQGPTVRQRKLAATLRSLREAAGLTPEQAAGALGWSRPKLVKIELAQAIPKIAEVEQILGTYGSLDTGVNLAVVQLARDCRQRGWWTAYGDVLEGSYVELEDAAGLIRAWQVQVVPGLLQTEDYARAVISSGSTYGPEEIDRRVQARMHRQTLLTRKDAPSLEIVLAEEVFRRPGGGSELIAHQARSLHEASKRPNVTIRVVPIEAGIHPGMGQGPLTIFGFPGPVDLDVAYLETLSGDAYVEDVAQVQACSVMFDRIASAALSPEESAAFLAAIAKE